jgi:hypothetical protein
MKPIHYLSIVILFTISSYTQSMDMDDESEIHPAIKGSSPETRRRQLIPINRPQRTSTPQPVKAPQDTQARSDHEKTH